jgi:succinoglycan biosynthesis transport protein ExoP
MTRVARPVSPAERVEAPLPEVALPQQAQEPPSPPQPQAALKPETLAEPPIASEPVEVDAIDAMARELDAGGESTRRITVVGASRNVGATMAAISLARSLAKQGRVVLIDLALRAPNLSVIASDPAAPGIAELVRGSASFGQIITRDRHSRVHLIMAGQTDVDAQAIMTSQRLAITLEALGRSYDHVVVDAGVVAEAQLERLASFSQRVLLVAGDVDDPATVAAEEALSDAGIADFTVLTGVPQAADATGDMAAA